MELLEQLKHKEHMHKNICALCPDKYINGMDELIRLNEKAIKADYNRQLYTDKIVEAVCLDKGKDSTQIWNYKFPITFSMIHNDTEVRVVFSWGEGNAQLDMSFDEYADLPSVKALTQ